MKRLSRTSFAPPGMSILNDHHSREALHDHNYRGSTNLSALSACLLVFKGIISIIYTGGGGGYVQVGAKPEVFNVRGVCGV